MKIVICGCGYVGSSVAEYMSQNNDIIVIDRSRDALKKISEELDVLVIHGDIEHPETLEKAGAWDADILIALTANDASNILVCQIAHHIFHVKRKIARLRGANFFAEEWRSLMEAFPINITTSFECELARNICRHLLYPFAQDVLALYGGKLLVLGVVIKETDPIIQTYVRQLDVFFPSHSVRVIETVRQDQVLFPDEEAQIMPGDYVFFLMQEESLTFFQEVMGIPSERKERLLILGGGYVGTLLVKEIEKHMPDVSCTFVEKDPRRTKRLVSQFDKALVIQGDVLDHASLKEALVDSSDVVVTVTDDDRTNILAALFAKNYGVQRALAIVNQGNYRKLKDHLGIDKIFNPTDLSLSLLLQHLQDAFIQKTYRLSSGVGEIIELFAYDTAPALGLPLRDLEQKGPNRKVVALVKNKRRTGEASLRELANCLRILTMDAVEKAKSGHPGMPMGMADVVAVLYSSFLKFDPKAPDWIDRDRLILSAGHGSMLLYAALYLTGYTGMTLDQLKHFRQQGSLTPGHPEFGLTPGVDMTTGPLGQGLAHAVGFALAEALLRRHYGAELMDHFTYVIAGDGCLMEGISHEAISLAGHLKLGRLIVLFDSNDITIDGPLSLSCSDNTRLRFEAVGWHVQEIDGHDEAEIRYAIQAAQREEKRPSLVICRTTIGYGSPHKSGKASAHGSPLGVEEIRETRCVLGWSEDEPFKIPSPLLDAWREVGERGQLETKAWKRRLEEAPADLRDSFVRRFARELPPNWDKALDEELTPIFEKAFQEKTSKATRQWSQTVLDVLAREVPELVGGSADLTPSNNTKAYGMESLRPGVFDGRYIHYGIREHGMAAAVNGMTLHGGFVSYGGTFFAFSDYARPAIRLAALMEIPSIFLMTHDSVGLGEDGPTHQPIEHLASFRAMPNLHVFRPADGVETAECWKLALMSQDRPSLICLSRQGVPPLRTGLEQENPVTRGGYILQEVPQDLEHHITLIATGSEVALACQVREGLAKEEIGVRVISMPCTTLFDQQPLGYREELLSRGSHPPVLKAVIEAAHPLGWERYLDQGDRIFALSSFGMSAPASDIFKAVQLEASAIIRDLIQTLHHGKTGASRVSSF
eukprot:g8350.t1